MAQELFLHQVLTRQQAELQALGWQPPAAAPQEHPQAVVSRFQSLVWDGSGDSGVRDLLLQYARSGSVMPMGLVLSLANDHGGGMTQAFCNKLLFTISTSGSLEAAYTVLQWMSAWGHQPDTSSYSHVLVTAVACFDAATVLHIARQMRDNDMVPSAELLRHALLITYARLNWGTSARSFELRQALALHQEMWLHFLLAVGVPMCSSALKMVVGQVARGLEALQLEPLPATAEWVAYAARCPWALDSEEAWVHPGAAKASGKMDAFGAEVHLTEPWVRPGAPRAPSGQLGASGAGAQAGPGDEPKDHWTQVVAMTLACNEDTDEYNESENTETDEDALAAPPGPTAGSSDESPILGGGCAQSDALAQPAAAGPPRQPAAVSAFSKARRGRGCQVRFAAQADVHDASEEEAEAWPQRGTEDRSLRRCYLEWLRAQPSTRQESLHNAYHKWQIDRTRQRVSSAPGAPPSRRTSF